MRYTMKIKHIFDYILDTLFPPHIKCIFCGAEISEKNEYDCCQRCLKTLPKIKDNYCQKCGAQECDDFVGVCMSCKKSNFNFESARSVFKYCDNVSKTILQLKFGSGKYLIKPLSNFMSEYLKTLDWEYDFICFVPMHENGLKKRKFNQAEELAKFIGKNVNKPVINIFSKTKDTKNQAQLNSAQRKTNLKDAFKLNMKNCANKSFVIIDDVFTTGSTTNELAKLLKEKSAKNVYVLTLAHSCLQTNI